jgi:hypothetical protein
LKEQYLEKEAVGRPRLQYLKQVARNTAAEKNDLQKFQMEAANQSKD